MYIIELEYVIFEYVILETNLQSKICMYKKWKALELSTN